MKHYFSKANQYANRHEYLLILLLIMIILRLPSLFEPFWYGDENIYLAIGQAMNFGETLYHTVTDFPNKPPAIYVLAALTQSVFSFRLFLLFWQIPGIIFFHRLVEKLTANPTLPFFSTLIFIFATSTPLIEGNIANAENFFIVPTIIAFSLLAPTKASKSWQFPCTKDAFVAGLFLSLAFLFKIHVLLDIAAAGFIFFFLPTKKLRSIFKPLLTPATWVFAAGLALPTALTLLILQFQDISPLDLFANAAGSTSYVAAYNSGEALIRFLTFGTLPARLALLGLISAFLFFTRRLWQPPTLIAATWLSFTLFAALLSGRPYPHYLLQTIPPLVLAGTLLFNHIKTKDKVLLLGFLSLFAAAYFRFDFSTWSVTDYYNNFIRYTTGQINRTEYYRRFDSRMPRNYALAERLRRLTLPTDKIYIWGTDPGVYVMAGRLQVEKLVTSFHVDDLDYFDQTATALETELPPVIVVMENEWRAFPQLDALLSEHYLLLDQIGDPDKSLSENHGRRALIYKRF